MSTFWKLVSGYYWIRAISHGPRAVAKKVTRKAAYRATRGWL